MFNWFRKGKKTEKPAVTNAPEAREEPEEPQLFWTVIPDGKGGAEFRKVPGGLEEEINAACYDTVFPPEGDPEEAWKRSLGKLRSFKERGAENSRLQQLIYNLLTNQTACYQAHFAEFLSVVGDMGTIVETAQELRISKRWEQAEEIAKPCRDYLRNHPDCLTPWQRELLGEEKKRLLPEGQEKVALGNCFAYYKWCSPLIIHNEDVVYYDSTHTVCCRAVVPDGPQGTIEIEVPSRIGSLEELLRFLVEEGDFVLRFEQKGL